MDDLRINKNNNYPECQACSNHNSTQTKQNKTHNWFSSTDGKEPIFYFDRLNYQAFFFFLAFLVWSVPQSKQQLIKETVFIDFFQLVCEKRKSTTCHNPQK